MSKDAAGLASMDGGGDQTVTAFLFCQTTLRVFDAAGRVVTVSLGRIA
jgi:hypothetical protein